MNSTNKNLSLAIKEIHKIFKNDSYLTKCLSVSYEVQAILAEYGILSKLVHANITMNDHKIQGHAWVEYDDIVIDITQIKENRIIKSEYFYKDLEIHKIIKYSFQETLDYLKVDLSNRRTPRAVWVDWFIYDN